MIDVGILKALIEYVNSFEPKPVVDAVIEFIDQICQGCNNFVLGKLYEFLTQQRDCFDFFKMFEQKIQLLKNHMIQKSKYGNQNEQPTD